MKMRSQISVASVGLIAGLAFAPFVSAKESKATVKETYAGKIEFQDQSITKKTAAFLHRRILQQRATQLVSWAMPMMNFEQLYPAMLSNTKASEDEVFFGLYDGYDGVYPFMTANVTTPYTVSLSDLSKTGPVVLDLPPGATSAIVDRSKVSAASTIPEVNSLYIRRFS